MQRCLLHKNKLESFISWCEENDIPTRPGKGLWQVLQVLTINYGWQVIFDKLDAPEHYSINQKLIPTVKRFIKETKQNADLS